MNYLEELFGYGYTTIETACETLAKSGDLSFSNQHRVFNSFGIDLDELSDTAIDYLSNRVNDFLSR